jgi:hypothetical protein
LARLKPDLGRIVQFRRTAREIEQYLAAVRGRPAWSHDVENPQG